MLDWRRYLGQPGYSPASKPDEAQLLGQVRRLEVRARQAMMSGLAGQYRSAFKGRGLEFEEVREYHTGDDVGTIDWNVTARTGRLHVKLYREERDLTVFVLADISASTRFGSGVMTVHDMIAEVAGLFALAAARRDRVGAILYGSSLAKVIPPRRSWRHGLRVVRELLSVEPEIRADRTAVGEAMQTAGRLLHRRGIVLVVTDAACSLPLRELTGLWAKHEVVVIRVSDQLMEGLRAPVVLPVREAEGRGRGLLAGPVRVRRISTPRGLDVLDLSTQEDYLPAVRALLKRREKRRVR